MTSVAKQCPECGVIFTCGPDKAGGHCWCDRFPPIIAPASGSRCLCPSCLTKALKPHVERYIAKIPAGNRTASEATKFHKPGVFLEHLDYYMEEGRCVFTEWYHLKRGSCCGNDCRHCPYRRK